MNVCESDILKILYRQGYTNQRILAEESGCSVGAVNNALKALAAEGLVDENQLPTQKAQELIHSCSPKNAIILAAGYGMRMVPINVQYSKAMIEVKGEVLIERQIRQLQEAGITDIHIVVGFMKEQFEYLIDKYGVNLIVNSQYSVKNNLHSLALAAKHLSNSYIVPCDMYCQNNPFSRQELYGWYLLTDEASKESTVRVNRKSEAVQVGPGEEGNAMIGIAYLPREQALQVRKTLEEMDASPKFDGCFWEEALFSGGRMILKAKVVAADQVMEINTYEQLRELDGDSRQLHTKTMLVAAGALQVQPEDITNIEILKKGMTNRSFIFSCKGHRYIMRIPGEGTDMLINRREEAAVYAAVEGRGICEDVLYINPENGYKVTRYFENARVCDPENWADVGKCMDFLRDFHGQRLKVGHVFDIFEKIEFYESLWNGQSSAYRDYLQTKEKVFALRELIDEAAEPWCLTHIDAVPDNFLFYPDENGRESMRLIDWEYASMQDPHVDIAMFAIYAMYDREQVDKLIDLYFCGQCQPAVRRKIYAYVAACGLLWSNWCEYKRHLGVEFGEYSLAQYRYAKIFYKIATDNL